MKTIIKTGLAAILMLAIACTKEKNTNPSASLVDNSSTPTSKTDNDDADKYPSVKIGTQKWMTKNLDVTHYRNGDKIPQVKKASDWGALTTGAWCWYNNDSATGAVYGKLYNWYAVNDPRGLAPKGWHVPSDTEWTTLSAFLGGDAIAGGKMKETGTTHWFTPNADATNSSGFTGLPGGFRYSDGTNDPFLHVFLDGNFWSSSLFDANYALYRYLSSADGNIRRNLNSKNFGYSVRCLKN